MGLEGFDPDRTSEKLERHQINGITFLIKKAIKQQITPDNQHDYACWINYYGTQIDPLDDPV